MSDVVITAMGARTAAGLDARAVAMMDRAGKSMFTPSHVVDRDGEPIGVSRVLSISDALMGRDRLVPLAVPALAEAWQRRRASGPVRLVLALPDPADAPSLECVPHELFEDLAAKAGVPLDVRGSIAVARGRAAGAEAMVIAAELVAGGKADDVIVGGVDTFFCPDLLERLDADFRVHGPNTRDGFVPGEGAAFIVLSRGSRVAGLRRFARVLGASVKDEPRPFGSREPTHALGMTTALRDALGSLRGERVRWVLSDVANERHRVAEWALASGRAHASFEQRDVTHQQPLLTTGDLGAASATVLAAIACVGWDTGFAPAPTALVVVHADRAPRGAILLEDGAA